MPQTKGIRDAFKKDIYTVGRDECARLLEAADGRVKTALVMQARNVNRDEAEQLLTTAHGRVGELLRPAE